IRAASSAASLGASVSVSPDPVLAGQKLVYTVTVANAGAAQSPAFLVSLPIPNFTTGTIGNAQPALNSSSCSSSVTGGCSPGEIVTWYFSAGLAAGAHTSFSFPVVMDSTGTPPDGAQVTASVNVDSGSTVGGPNAASAVVFE